MPPPDDLLLHHGHMGRRPTEGREAELQEERGEGAEFLGHGRILSGVWNSGVKWLRYPRAQMSSTAEKNAVAPTKPTRSPGR